MHPQVTPDECDDDSNVLLSANMVILMDQRNKTQKFLPSTSETEFSLYSKCDEDQTRGCPEIQFMNKVEEEKKGPSQMVKKVTQKVKKKQRPI